jgi:hypothetical protein
VLDFLRKGDVLIVTRVDRLARSIGDLQDIVRVIRERGAGLKATEQPIDTSTAAGKCFLDMLGVFAEFETNLRRERQLEGIAKAKAAGVYKGRFAMLSPKLLELLRDWYRIARPAVWLFPGQDPMLPMTTRQFNRAVHAAAAMAEIKKRVTPHTLRHSFAPTARLSPPTWRRCAGSRGTSMQSPRSADPRRCSPIWRAIPTASPSPTAG